MAKPNGSAQAFPTIDYRGMSLRDYFAAQAIQGLLACSHFNLDIPEDMAKVAYKIADAMVVEHEK